MFEVTYYDISSRSALSSSITKTVDVTEVLKYLEKAQDKHIIIASLTFGGKRLDVSALCLSLQFK
jgi:hypothetical protein